MTVTWRDVFDELVPETGEATTVEGEMAVAIGKIGYEASNNGLCNIRPVGDNNDRPVRQVKLARYLADHATQEIRDHLPDGLEDLPDALATSLEAVSFNNVPRDHDAWRAVDRACDILGDTLASYLQHRLDTAGETELDGVVTDAAASPLEPYDTPLDDTASYTLKNALDADTGDGRAFDATKNYNAILSNGQVEEMKDLLRQRWLDDLDRNELPHAMKVMLEEDYDATQTYDMLTRGTLEAVEELSFDPETGESESASMSP